MRKLLAVCSDGEIPRFEYVDNNGKVYDLQGGIQPYSTHAVQMVGSMNEVPVEFSVLKAYPNPFNPTTNISFEISKTSAVSLTVYDITGSFVEQIVDQTFDMGRYSFSWDAGSYPSGVYMLKLDTGRESLAQKLVLLK